MKFLLETVAYSYAQIFFSNRKWFGIVILLGSLISPIQGFMALFGVILANLIAYILKFDTDKIRSGFYGFNGLLVGAAIAYYFELTFTVLLLLPIFIIITFFITAVLEHYLATAFNLPGLSLPFILSTYIFLIFITNYSSIYSVTQNYSSVINQYLHPNVQLFLRSLSLIIFQPSIITGLIILIAILFFSRVLFVLSIIGFVTSILSVNLILPQQANQLMLLASFNSILVSFAVGGSLVIPSRKSLLLAVISVIMTVIAVGFFYRLLYTTHLPILVLPFNAIVLSVIYSLKFRKDHTDLTLLYFQPGSPEENYYYHHNRKARFDRFKYFEPELPFFGEWKVSQGFDGQFTHKKDWKYAWDFVIVNEKGEEFSNNGNSVEDYYCYNIPVTSPLDGEVVKIIDGISDNPIGEANTEKNWGNTIIIKHDKDFFSSISHLKEGSFKVKEGDYVKKGEMLAACGNSGRSPYPHIHFQFQATDKLGDKTLKYPIAFYTTKKDNGLIFESFNFPEEGAIVQNIQPHKLIKNAFDFRLGNKRTFSYEVNKKIVNEDWEVKIDIYNLTYIENNFGDKVYFHLSNRIFYFTSYIGQKNRALYYFYLNAMHVPICMIQDLSWNGNYAISELPISNIRYISELFLLIKNFLSVTGKYSFQEITNGKTSYLLKSEINVKGTEIFSFYKQNFSGLVEINEDGEIDSFSFYENKNQIFKTKNIKEV